jgi:N-acetylglucosamine-6-phosphate deacetylase
LSNTDRQAPLLDRLGESHGVPGWIDLQVNGHAGVSFCSQDLTLDRVAEATRELVERGTHAFLPTVVTAPPEVMKHCLSVLGEACEHPALSKHLPGIHLEGPFLSPEPGARGAHPSEHMLPPELDYFGELQEAARGHVKILTLAPELPGAIPFIKTVSETVLCSAGHTLAEYDILREAVDNGLKLWTHIGNGIPTTVDRHNTPIVAQLAVRRIVPSIITDGFHLPESFIRAVIATKGTDGCFVVSDQTHLAGMPPGEYSFGRIPVVLEPNGFLHMRDEPYLAGSSRTMAECMEHLDGLGFLKDEDLCRLGYENPSRILEGFG